MVEKKKRGFVIGLFVVVLAAAVYLNWQFAPSEEYVEPKLSEATADSSLGEAMFVSAEGDRTQFSDSDAVSASAESDYFDRLISEREKARNDSIAVLEDIINDASKSGADKNDAVTRTALIAQQIQYENSIESLVKAKGFSNCVAFVSDTQASVVLPSGIELTPAKISTISDIIISQTNLPASCISISQAKIN